ncbi:MAG TPA: hypothetical protein VMS55_13400 [Myxococcota bacterium]|nr:hypothetical protein [Myxococcota bacterium]
MLLIVGIAGTSGLLLAASARANNFVVFNRAFGAGSPFGVPKNGPATWTGTAAFGMGPPRSFMVAAHDAHWTTMFVNPTPPTAAGVIFSSQSVSVTGPINPGTFKAGGGPGNFTFNPPPDPTYGTRIGTAKVIKGPNQFGGAVAHSFKFLSKLKLNFGFAIFSGAFPLNEVQGAKTPPGATKPTQSYTGTFHNTAPPHQVTSIFLRANFFSWTTGKAIGKDNGGRFNTTVTLTGYDHRTPQGLSGVVQMVSPFLFSSFNGGAFGVNHLSGVNTLKYSFIPEPGSTSLLASGLGAVLLLGFLDRRRRIHAETSAI